MRRLSILAAILAAAAAASGQEILRGTVTDRNGAPLEAATVQLFRGGDRRMAGYALTNAQGVFSLASAERNDSLRIVVSFLGYKTLTLPVAAGETLRIRLEQEVFSLKEVEVRPGRVWGQQDTINYDVAQFLLPKDESIRDVIRKLPGISVDEAGRIAYNGKDISNLYVEGLDLTGGRYARIINNLDAKAVETVQLLENHQPIRILQERVKTNDVALNLKLRPDARDRWMAFLQGALGAAPLLWKGSVNAMQLGRHSQSAYLYKGNNAGQDVTEEQSVLPETRNGALREANTPRFLSQPSLQAPLKKERFLQNNVHTLSANRLYRIGETTRLRLNAGYTHDVRRQVRGSETRYYRTADTVCIDEQSDTRLSADRAEVSIALEENASGRYLTNRFHAAAEHNAGRSDYTTALRPSLSQEIQTPEAGVQNDFRLIRNAGSYTLEGRSLLRYTHRPSILTIGGEVQRLPLGELYADHSLAFLRKKGALTAQYTAGMSRQWTTIQNGMRLYAVPSWQWNTSRWNAALNLPLVWTSYPGVNFGRAAANPLLSLRYRHGYAWNFSLSAHHGESYGEATDLYAAPYRTDYRTTVAGNGSLPVYRQQTFAATAGYKRTVQEFFASLSLRYTRRAANRMYEQVFDAGQITFYARALKNISSEGSLRGTLSKGFYDWRLNTSLAFTLACGRGGQLIEGGRMPFRHGRMQYEPEISWAPRRGLELTYRATFRYGSSASMAPLWNIVQKVQLSWEVGGLEILPSCGHYHNGISRDKAINAVFPDLSLRWKPGRWQLELSAVNLFNIRTYSYTDYDAIRSYTSWINIRGRECILGLRYALR